MTDQPPVAPLPIVVHATPTQPQIEAGIRQFFLAAGPLIGLMAATGWGKTFGLNDYVTLILQYAGPISGAVAFIWGQYETRKTAVNAATMANAIPDNSVAHTK